MRRADLIGNGKYQLIPAWQPKEGGKNDGIAAKGKTFRTQRTEYNNRGGPSKRRKKIN